MTSNLDPRRLFPQVAPGTPVMVAVSGGSDSVALLLLASAWAHHSGAHLQVVTVDHGLRPEAAAEAAFVAGVCEGIGHPHVTLAWDGMKPSSGISNAARNARYRLIEEFAKDIGIETIVTGHTANDQAETIIMRNSRSGDVPQSRGLSGMAQETKLPGCALLVRPLLDVTRAQLVSYLKEHQQSWIEDPTNQDSSFERVRVREAIGADERLIRLVCRFGKINARERLLVSQSVSSLLQKCLKGSEGLVFTISETDLKLVERPSQVLAIQVVLAMAGGAEYLVSGSNVEEFLDDADAKRITLGNSVLERHRNSFRVYREKRNLPSLLVAPGEEMIWDGRLQISNKSSTTYFCGTMDASRLEEAEAILGRKLPVSPRAAINSMPFMCGDGDDLYLPFVKGFEKPANLEVSLVSPAIEHFCPAFDFPLLDVLKFVNSAIIGKKLQSP